MNWRQSKCKPGDIVRIKLGAIYHYGIFVSGSEVIQFGFPPTRQYLSAAEDIIVCSTDINTFSCGKIVEKGSCGFKERLKRFSRKKIVKNARSKLGSGGYNIIHNNCEHFVFQCAFGVKYSVQEETARKLWNDRPVLDVYITEIPSKVQITPVYPSERSSEIEKCSNPTLKAAKYCVWQLLLFAAERSFGMKAEKIAFKKRRKGGWYCKDFCFSLSHTDKAAAVAVSEAQVGVDIENTETFKLKYGQNTERLSAFIDKALTKTERSQLGRPSADGFLWFWTKKEAIYKASDSSEFRPARINTSLYGTATNILKFPCRAMVSVCAGNAEKAKYYVVKGTEAIPAGKDLFE